jgi:hypothetical protein
MQCNHRLTPVSPLKNSTEADNIAILADMGKTSLSMIEPDFADTANVVHGQQPAGLLAGQAGYRQRFFNAPFPILLYRPVRPSPQATP